MIFIFLVVLLPLRLAVIASIIFGLLILAIISYIIALHIKINLYRAIIGNIIIALLIVLTSKHRLALFFEVWIYSAGTKNPDVIGG
jgi:VIT1/CCC1 family predicted Fe2+/Mn2+ transporter